MTIEVKNNELSALLRLDENDVLDFKSATLLIDPSAKNRYKIAKHLVGFANYRGGKLVFGINDEREPEGKTILEEEALRTLSEITSSRISPPIDISYTFFSADSGDLSKGSVLVVKLQQSSSPMPHAIIEASGGKIRKREYRIRAGESTRLVSNDELRAMFEDRIRVILNSSETLHFLLEDDYSPAETKYKPQYQYAFDRHFSELKSQDESLLEKIKSGHPNHSRPAMERIVDAQYALTVSTILSHPEFSFVSKLGLLEKIDNQIDDIAFELKSIAPSNIIQKGDGNPLIDETEMKKVGVFPRHSPKFDYFKIPESAKVYVWEDFDGFDITNEHFRLSFSIELVEVGVGLPTPHPDSLAEPGEYGLRTQNSSNCTMYAHVSVDSEFRYPDQEFAEFESYRAYCEEIIEIFETEFDWDSYIEQLPNNETIRIEEKVDEVLRKLNEE